MAEPRYREIAEDLRTKIESGELAPGAQLPTEIDLMDQHHASRNTVRDAIKLLTARGLVEPRAGRGTFVVEEIVPYVTTLTDGGGEGEAFTTEVKDDGRRPTVNVPDVRIRQAHGAVAYYLRIEEGAEVVSRQQERFIDGSPFSLQTSYYPMTTVDDLGARKLIHSDDIEEGTVTYLATEFGLTQAGYRDYITVRVPNRRETEFFRLPNDGRIEVFEIFRVAFDEEKKPFRLTVTVYPSDRNQFVINSGRVPAGQPPYHP